MDTKNSNSPILLKIHVLYKNANNLKFLTLTYWDAFQISSANFSLYYTVLWKYTKWIRIPPMRFLCGWQTYTQYNIGGFYT